METIKGLTADELAEEYTYKPEHWIVTWFLDTTQLRVIEVALAKERRLRRNPHYKHKFPWFQKMDKNTRFEMTVGCVIMINAILIGAQTSENSDGDGYQAMETLFLLFFLWELIVRLFAHGWSWVFDYRNFLDFFLVVVPIVAQWILIPLGVPADQLKKFQILRILRLVRLVKMVRMFPQFQTLWVMLRGLVECGRTLFWTYVMIITMLFIFGIVGTDFIAKDPLFLYDDAVQEYFGTLPDSIFTLMQVMTLDSWTFICRPMMKKAGWVGLYFIALIMLVVMVLLNLITAVIVENSFAVAHEDEDEIGRQREKEREAEISSLGEIFKTFDTDGSGTVTFEEFQHAAETNPLVQNKLDVLEIDKSDLGELWSLLDDGDGTLSSHEFCEGLRKVKAGVKAKDLLECLRQMRVLQTRTQRQRKRVSDALVQAESMLDRLEQARFKMASTVYCCKETLEQVRACPIWRTLVPDLKIE